ncbi:PIN domain-containing protein [Chryseobacterium sp.]|uniref:PIN domain-containing protein n=1 Tax=Chryseobacterium sp. TaxID=1871047 RepID=UPI0024E24735|nr:PIN domain-containing protein [Chryseobacterium sp.]
MNYICLDTNTWIYLANGTEPVRLLHFIEKQIQKGNITVLLPKIVKTEWDNNKEMKVMQGSINYFKNIRLEFDKILKLLGDNNQHDVLNFLIDEENNDQDDLIQIIEKFKQKKASLTKAVSRNITLIDNIFKYHSQLIEIEDHIHMKAGYYALERKAPFKSKNSFADALILFSLLDYVKKNCIEDSMFISYNISDFCEKKTANSIEIHPDLIQEFETAKCRYYRFVGEAINTIEEIITKEELDLIEYLQNEYEPEYCDVCSEMNDRLSTVSFYKHSLIDERIVKEIDMSQLEFDFDTNYTTEPTNKKLFSTVEVGSCEWCSTEHFICVNCNTKNVIWEGEYGDRKECEGCGLNYIIEDYNDWEENKPSYIIPKETVTCEKCGEEFEEEDMIENLCADCEEGYSYGDK